MPWGKGRGIWIDWGVGGSKRINPLTISQWIEGLFRQIKVLPIWVIGREMN
jgi:hypothetical protein